MNFAHISSNMIGLVAMGSKVEGHLGSLRFAAVMGLVVFTIRMIDVPTAVLFNAVAAMVGITDRHVSNLDQRPDVSFEPPLVLIIRQQVSLSTCRIGFSGVLFALDVLGHKILPTGSSVDVKLPIKISRSKLNLAYAISQQFFWHESFPQIVVMHNHTQNAAANGTHMPAAEECSIKLRVPAKWVPWVRLLIAQCADPVHVSFIGHFSGLLAGVLVVPHELWSTFRRLIVAFPMALFFRDLVRKSVIRGCFNKSSTHACIACPHSYMS